MLKTKAFAWHLQSKQWKMLINLVMDKIDKLASDVEKIMNQQLQILNYIKNLKHPKDDPFVTVEYMATSVGMTKHAFQNQHLQKLNFLKRIGQKGQYRAKLSDFIKWKESL